MSNKRPIGTLILVIIGFLLFLILLLGQTMSFINYDFTVSTGLQESVDLIGEMGVAMNKGFGVGDTIVYIPLLLMGLIGILIRKKWGSIIMIAALGITIYWPIVIIFILLFARGVPGFYFTSFISYTIILLSIVCYGVWGMWYLSKQGVTR